MPKRICSTTKVTGKVIEAPPSTGFVVQLENGKRVVGVLTGPTAKYYIRLRLGHQVDVQLMENFTDRGKIVRVYLKSKPSADQNPASKQ